MQHIYYLFDGHTWSCMKREIEVQKLTEIREICRKRSEHYGRKLTADRCSICLNKSITVLQANQYMQNRKSMYIVRFNMSGWTNTQTVDVILGLFGALAVEQLVIHTDGGLKQSKMACIDSKLCKVRERECVCVCVCVCARESKERMRAYRQLRARRALLQTKDILLRTRRALLP